MRKFARSSCFEIGCDKPEGQQPFADHHSIREGVLATRAESWSPLKNTRLLDFDFELVFPIDNITTCSLIIIFYVRGLILIFFSVSGNSMTCELNVKTEVFGKKIDNQSCFVDRIYLHNVFFNTGDHGLFNVTTEYKHMSPLRPIKMSYLNTS